MVAASPSNAKAKKGLEQAQAALKQMQEAEEEAEAERERERVEAERLAREEKKKAAEAKVAEAAAAAAAAAAEGGQGGQAAQESARKAAEDAYWAGKMEQMAADNGAAQKKKLERGFLGGKSQASAGAAQDEPEHELTTTTEGYKLVVSLPGVKSMKAVEIDVSPDEFLLKSSKPTYALRLCLPQSVDVDAVGAKFSKRKGELTVSLTKLVGTLGMEAGKGTDAPVDDAFERAAHAPKDTFDADAEATEAMMKQMAEVLGEGGSMAGLMEQCAAEERRQQATKAH